MLATHAEELAAARATTVAVVVAAVAADTTVVLLNWAWLYPQPWLDRLLSACGGVFGKTLVGSLGTLAFALAIACGLGRLRPRDLGLVSKQIVRGLAIVLAVWLVGQAILALAALIAGQGLALAPTLTRDAVRGLSDQVFGNAFEEEVIFRGFLAVQCVLIARRTTGARAAWVIGVLVSQVIFALTHIPQRWIVLDRHGTALLADLASLTFDGICYALIYVRTGNLGIAIGYHALGNAPLSLVRSPWPPLAVYAWTVFALVVAWPLLEARHDRRVAPRDLARPRGGT